MSLTSAPVKHAGSHYLIELSLVIALYVGAILIRPRIGACIPGEAALIGAKLLPILPVWLGLWTVVRHYRRIDEYAKFRLLRNVAAAFGIGSCLIVSYALLTDFGLPPLALTWAWPTLATSWVITSAIFEIERA
jgi:hypothetical protein